MDNNKMSSKDWLEVIVGVILISAIYYGYRMYNKLDVILDDSIVGVVKVDRSDGIERIGTAMIGGDLYEVTFAALQSGYIRIKFIGIDKKGVIVRNDGLIMIENAIAGNRYKERLNVGERATKIILSKY